MTDFLSFDIEEHWRSYESRGIPYEASCGLDLRMLSRILDSLRLHGQRATFFVLASFAEREPQVVKEIAAAGQEVASHGYSHQVLTRHTPSSFQEDARRAKGILEDLGGRPVLGYRAAQWSLTPATAWSLPLLAELGHRYDSSAFPGWVHRFGWPGMQPRPQLMPGADGSRIIEFPASRLGIGSLATQACGGFYWRVLPDFVHAYAARPTASWYFHAYDLDPTYPLPNGLPLSVRFLKKFRTSGAWGRFTALLINRRFAAYADAIDGIREGRA